MLWARFYCEKKACLEYCFAQLSGVMRPNGAAWPRCEPPPGPLLDEASSLPFLYEPGAATGASTILGSRIVKVEPRPGSLSTVMSPPIILQKRRNPTPG